MIYLYIILKKSTQFLALLWVFWLCVGVSSQDKQIGSKIGMIAIGAAVLTLIVWLYMSAISEGKQQTDVPQAFDNFLAGVGVFLFLLLILAIAIPSYL